MTAEVRDRLEEEFRLIARHNLAGFLLLYREIVRLARGILAERGLIEPDTPLEERPPGRGRGSSVALLVGYLIGISHIDPLRWQLPLERFLPEDMHHPPRHRPGLPPRPPRRPDRAGPCTLRPGRRRPGRGRRHLLLEGRRPGPGQGPGAAAGRAAGAGQADRCPQRYGSAARRCGICPPSAIGSTLPAGAP